MGEPASEDGAWETAATEALPGTHAAAAPGLPVGMLVAAKYRIVGILGAGGMGIVYDAVHEKLRRPVALKVPSSAKLSATTAARLFREARVAAAIEPGRTASVLDVGSLPNGTPFLVLEKLEGENVAQRLAREGPLGVADAADLVAEACLGLVEVHRRGVVHRDLKPSNLFLVEGAPRTSSLRILDFGIASINGSEAAALATDASLTATGTTLGSPPYMAPEQLRAASDVDARADVWALAVTLHQLLTNKLPFPGTGAALVAAIAADAPRTPRDEGVAVPAPLEALLSRCLSKDPAGRPADASALGHELSRFSSPAMRALLEAARRPGATPSPTRWPRQAAIGLLASLAVAAVLAVVAEARRHDSVPSAGSLVPSASPSPTTPPVPMAIRDLPIPASTVPSAATAYSSGLDALQDNDWELARRSFERAATLDAEMAAAHVQRLVTEADSDARDVKKLREIYNAAWRLRGELSPRDLALLEAHEPLVGREPQDIPAYRERIAKASRQFPGDVQLALLAAMEEAEPSEAVVAFDRVLALDPTCANALQLQARYQLILGRTSEAITVLDRCVALSPASQCLEQRVALWAERGECDKMETDAREWVAKSAGGPYAYYLLANALTRRDGDGDGAVIEALRQRTAQLAGESRVVAAAVEPARLDVLRGRFAAAEKRARSLLATIDDSPNARPHAAAAGLLVELLLETERSKEAARVAHEFLGRAPAWNRDGGVDDGIPTMIGALSQSGDLSSSEAESRAAAWVDDKLQSGYVLMFPYLQVYARAGLLASRRDAELALGAPSLSFPKGQAYLPVMPARALYGRALALAHRDGAVAELARAAKSCAPLEDPFVHTRAQLWWGLASEEAGDVAAACSAYGVVVARWGRATPRSSSATTAATRARALGCPPP